uniref:ADP/ATP translocase n=1 Tax=Ditylum brightwellii TaxID=49249 RepID=A0A7S1Z5D2_9STRA|mmetsp:Transcript_24412/g.36438  ORF Transcript_24412/g.36438 Transcript_24412/m.36438 type:complete len:410 (+) Transcript_24412:117-1346(+)
MIRRPALPDHNTTGVVVRKATTVAGAAVADYIEDEGVIAVPSTSLEKGVLEQPPSFSHAVEKRKKYRAFLDSSAKDALAGACAGAFAKTAVAPIERVKILLQLQNSLKGNNASAVKGGSSTISLGNGRLTAMQVWRSVYNEQGVLAFWRGNTPNVLRQGGTTALNFMLMDWYKQAIQTPLAYTLKLPSNRSPEARKKRRARLSSFLSGGLAGGTTTTFLYPIEFLRTRLAMDIGATIETRQYPRGMRDVFISTWNADGVRGLYQGYGIALFGVVVYRALHLGGYDAVKSELIHRKTLSLEYNQQQHSTKARKIKFNDTLTIGERFAVAQIVSVVAGTMCYPIDSVRRRLMMQAGEPVELRRYRNSLDCFRKVMTQEGIRGFYLGIGPNLVRSFGGALLLVTYDAFKVMI